MLFRGLNYLGQQILETTVISNNGETEGKEVLTPLLYRRRNHEQFPDTHGCTKKLRAEGFAEEGNGMSLLR